EHVAWGWRCLPAPGKRIPTNSYSPEGAAAERFSMSSHKLPPPLRGYIKIGYLCSWGWQKAASPRLHATAPSGQKPYLLSDQRVVANRSEPIPGPTGLA